MIGKLVEIVAFIAAAAFLIPLLVFFPFLIGA